jgi:chemosensory pili system protein ChpA (sensor histidine kinase/response regulator)
MMAGVSPVEIVAGTDASAPVLVVDDDVALCLIIASALEDMGHRAEWLTDPVVALARVREGRYALVISDVNMPRMQGTELATEIAGARPGLPVILISGLASVSLCRYAVENGRMLPAKPFRREALLAAVSGLLRPAVAA